MTTPEVLPERTEEETEVREVKEYHPRVYLPQNVLDAAKDRIRWLYKEFDQVVVSFSGGKDSTVALNLTLEVAEELGKLPVPVIFIDQEAEWQCVIDYIRRVMADPRVEPHWLQCPLLLFNATSTDDTWLRCWDEEVGPEGWMREKEPGSIHENTFGTERFTELFKAYGRSKWGDRSLVEVTGVRCEESPARELGLTTYETFRGETWGKIKDRSLRHYAFHPLYDWSYLDIWTAIVQHGWEYCTLYDDQYRLGIPIRQMRVSNVHHETAIKTLEYLQEVEPETWNRLTRRLRGLNTVKHLREDFQAPRTLPVMFKDWEEYRDYLIENMISDPEKRALFYETFRGFDDRFRDTPAWGALLRTEIAAVLVNDYHGTKLTTFEASHLGHSKNAGKLLRLHPGRRT